MRQDGFTYLALLFAVAIMGAVLGATAVVWYTQVQRDKEQDLLFVGHAYRQAIAEYYEKTPGNAKQYPKKLEDLLEDKRQARLTRYLRKLYRDPVTGSKEWGIVAGPGETIAGVYSLSTKAPIKTANFDDADKDFSGAASYADWKFLPAQPTPTAPTPTPAGQPDATPSGQPTPPGQANPPPAAANPAPGSAAQPQAVKP
jgi:type II secretory pathway pseudopilin PulG